ncbi:MAG: DUF1015 domain-containing protein [Actinobacteria bacterium]|nr:DUF1015 domain-containing protein [Actinomycetota bacterium]
MSPDDTLARIGVRLADILVPRRDVDLARWAVVACDQYTAQPDYWARVEDFVGDAPSTLRLVYPEVHLGEPDPQARIVSINAAMRDYVEQGLFETYESTLMLVRRETGRGVVRWGVMVALDLEAYSWNSGDRTLIRATEGTILDRIPPRKRIRENATLELPHIVVLISDPARSVIEPLAAAAPGLAPAYDVELMEHGGRVTGWPVAAQVVPAFADALGRLHDSLDPADPLLFAMGDGNHSFATAKSCWQDLKPTLSEAERETHPARWALVEIENIFDPGLEFEPIHRVLFDVSRDDLEAELSRHCRSFTVSVADSVGELMSRMESAAEQTFGYGDESGYATYSLVDPDASIPAGTLQTVIDALVAKGCDVDYIHGAEACEEIGRRPGNLSLYLPAVPKETFFASIVADGTLPRKTFSLGEADDKRYYLEARRIRRR